MEGSGGGGGGLSHNGFVELLDLGAASLPAMISGLLYTGAFRDELKLGPLIGFVFACCGASCMGILAGIYVGVSVMII